MAGLLPKLETFYQDLPVTEKTPVRKQGLMQLRTGIIQIYVGYITLINSDCLTPASKQILLAALVDVAPNYTAVMSKANRNEIKQFIEKVLPAVDKTYQPALQKIIQYLTIESCNELCAIT